MRSFPQRRRRIRMFVDDVSGVGLWDEEGALEPEDLPLSDELVAELTSWVDAYTRSIEGATLDKRLHDDRGRLLCARIQGHLGDEYDLRFKPQHRR